MLGDGEISRAVIVSTLAEAWHILPLVKSGAIEDILFGLPLVPSKIPELEQLANKVKSMQLLIDNVQQLESIEEYNVKQKQHNKETRRWPVMIKVDSGTQRAGIPSPSSELLTVTEAVLDSTDVELGGFYCHSGHSYSAMSITDATNFFSEEIDAACDAFYNTQALIQKRKQQQPQEETAKLILSVGATPTAHAAECIAAALDYSQSKTHLAQQDKGTEPYHRLHEQYKEMQNLEGDRIETVERIRKALHRIQGTGCEFELHAGNYCLSDLQQLSTGCISGGEIATSVVAEVASVYPGRGAEPGEILVNTGVLSLAREASIIPGFGTIRSSEYGTWYVDRLSQEHGILRPAKIEDENVVKLVNTIQPVRSGDDFAVLNGATKTNGTTKVNGISPSAHKLPRIGDRLLIWPQHSCIVAQCFPQYFVIDKRGDSLADMKIVDVWEPCRGWY